MVYGAPLKLDFETVMRRSPANSRETELELDEAHIKQIYAKGRGGCEVPVCFGILQECLASIIISVSTQWLQLILK